MASRLALGSFALGFAVTTLMLPLIVDMVRSGGLVYPNHEGRRIPGLGGLVFVVAALAGGFVESLVRAGAGAGAVVRAAAWPPVVLVTAVGLAGVVDDVAGSRALGGFSGHLGALVRGRLTTGGFKVVVGGLAAVAVALCIKATMLEAVGAALVIALAANFVNLLDTRPGRAGKAFLAAAAAVGLATRGAVLAPAVASVVGACVYYLPFDMSGEVMMGDTGSNALGAALGYQVVQAAGPRALVGAIVVLALLTLLAERVPLSSVIDRVTLLRYIDQLGTGQHKGNRGGGSQ